MEHLKVNSKEQALFALMATWKDRPEEGLGLDEWNENITHLEEKAIELGATPYEVIKAQFQAEDEEYRQILLDSCYFEPDEWKSAEQKSQYFEGLRQIAIDFKLKPPYGSDSQASPFP